ncbi:MAG: hypothetical protein CME70_01485 [Halobacteriovorax sp.]|nr:hypothetical protein [Halobacteriovorax sp.]|tara:strand:- start:2051 stop:2791 length:741 start_codon:yes stop_codon:yes gene_type:complete
MTTNKDYCNKDITFFLSTKNRPVILDSSLKSIMQYSPGSSIIVGNASTGAMYHETSDIISLYKNTLAVNFSKDPGVSLVYNQLHDMILTKFCVVWCDDAVLMSPITTLLDHFEDPNILLVALPMIDNAEPHALPGNRPWPTDERGCALWQTPSGRCAHYSITRTKHFQKIGNVCGTGNATDVIDNFFHRNTNSSQRIWPNDKAYVLHNRVDDETRWQMMFNTEKKIHRFSKQQRDAFYKRNNQHGK